MILPAMGLRIRLYAIEEPTTPAAPMMAIVVGEEDEGIVESCLCKDWRWR